MIVGIFLRNFKTYEGYHFIPFSTGLNEKLNLFIGNNGSGKSSILEALDVFFNDREFILNNNARSRDASVTPVFLIKKEKMNLLLKPDQVPFAEVLSEFLWNENLNSLYGSNPSMKMFAVLRESLMTKYNKDEYYFLLFGHELENKDYSLISLDSKADSKFSESGYNSVLYKRHINNLGQLTKNAYNYIYIPVETSITDFLKLEASGMQSLMNKDLKNDIEHIIGEHKFEVDGRGHRKRNISISTYINERLKEYIEKIEETIQILDNDYHFNRTMRSTNVNPKDFSDVIINTYFSKRRLQKKDREISHLSSGERKKALIDIAFSFISQSSSTDREVVLAIDEPESSLHISMCFDQYMRIEQMANSFNIQSFITTHWYGGLPILSSGRLYHVTNVGDYNPTIDIFPLENYFELRKHHPDEINLKSYYDLTSSIISSIRNKKQNWLIVEGLADKKYLEHYFPDSHNLKILPVGGCPIVKKVYEYLYLPCTQEEEELAVEGRVYCLIDTDAKSISTALPSRSKGKNLIFRRLQLEGDTIKLLPVDQSYQGTKVPTELEEALNPAKFYTALSTVIHNTDNYLLEDSTESIAEIFSHYELDVESQFSFIKGENTFLKCITAGRSNRTDLKLIHKFFDLHKDAICSEYIKLDKGTPPQWIDDIFSFYTT